MSLVFNKETDTEQTVTLDPKLLLATWQPGCAPAGQAVPLEVRTVFVGYGAKITGKIQDSSSSATNLSHGNLDIEDAAEMGTPKLPRQYQSGNETQWETVPR